MAFTTETAKMAGMKSSRRGTPNNLTKAARENISLIVNRNYSKFEEELKKLEGKEYCDVMLKLMEYHIPKLNRTEIVDDQETIFVSFKEDIN